MAAVFVCQYKNRRWLKTFLIDDIILRVALGEHPVKPLDTIWLLGLLKDYALKEKYDIKKINNMIKENRLLFEIGELTEEEYKKKHEQLLEEREKAEEVLKSLSKDVRIQEGIQT